jgi:hypothetical protein
VRTMSRRVHLSSAKSVGSVLGCIALLILALLLWGYRVTEAQSSNPPEPGWSPDVPLIEENEPVGYVPQLAVDRQGRVHVFWIAWTGSGPIPPGEVGDTILYRRLENGIWTKTKDILVAPEGHKLIIIWVEVDDRDYLNLLWFDIDNQELLLSQAHTSVADRVRNWTTQVLSKSKALDNPSSAHLAIQPDGKIHVVYVRDTDSVEYITSDDYGRTWSAPHTIWKSLDPGIEGAEVPRIAVDIKGYLHVTWTFKVRLSREAVFYARSVDGGLTWNTREIQRRLPGEGTVAFSNVVVRNGNEIHLTWNRGAGSRLGRYHAWSLDNGETWSEPEPFLPEYVSGQTQYPLMVVDSAGTLHLITMADSPNTAPNYTYWNGTAWSPMYHFPQKGNSQNLSVALAVGLGNMLHVVHESSLYNNRLAYTTLTTTAPPIAAQSIQDPLPTATPLPPTPTLQPTQVVKPTPQGELNSPQPEGAVNTSPAFPLVVSTTAVVLLLVLSLGWRLIRLRA